MPELPEVETIKNDLSLHLLSHLFTDIILHCPRAVQKPSPEEFRQSLKGENIEGLDRRGKYLIIHLSDSKVLILHLGMSGSLILMTAGSEPHRHSRTIFILDNGCELHFVDPRKFGKIWLVTDKQEIVGKLGIEPLNPSFTSGALQKILTKRNVPIKALLLDQKLIAGIGNMYADEALFSSGIHPMKRGKDFNKEDIRKLHRSIRKTLQRSIHLAGATTSDYRRPNGTTGEAHLLFNVAHRKGKLCPVCNTTIQRILIRNRGSYFCPKCQQKK